MAEGGGRAGPPDLIPDIHPQPVDLVSSVTRPVVENLVFHSQQPVDIVENLPVGIPVNGEASVDIIDSLPRQPNADGVDAGSWWKGKGATAAGPTGIAMPCDKDAENYNMNHRRRGKAFIFNHMNFDTRLNLKTRNGTNNDRDNLRVTLRQLDFDVEVYNDLPFKEMDRILENASMDDHSDADCIFVAVMSHGELGILYSSDQPFKPDRLWGHFTADKCRTLAGKPKMFFIQACQGDQLDQGVQMVRHETDAGAQTYKIPAHADFLIAYSTIPGFYSWRNTTAGSWFVQALCHVLQREGHSRDMLSMLTRVARRVAFDFQSNVPGDYIMHEKKQIPCITSMLTRDVLFTKKN